MIFTKSSDFFKYLFFLPRTVIKSFPRRLSLLRSSSLKRWNRRRDETSLYNSWTTQSGKFRTPYDQVPHLDGGRCNAPAPTSSCGWLHQHNRWTTQSWEFRTPYDQVRMVGIRNLSFSKILQLPFDADSFRISISVLWFYALFKFKKIIVNFIEYLKLTMII